MRFMRKVKSLGRSVGAAWRWMVGVKGYAYGFPCGSSELFLYPYKEEGKGEE